jgi:CTP-dependent riboflavin kinase
MTILHGTVVSGQGNFSYWLEQLQDHYTRKTGMRLFPGTLNIQLDSPYSLPPERLRLEKEQYGGAVSVNIVPCRIFGRPAFLLRTDLNDSGQGPHPKTIIEIATDIKLRDEYHLVDGDCVSVEILADSK